MSRYELRGTLNLGEEPDPGADARGPNGLTTDYHWEYGYDPGGFSYYAQLYDDVPDDGLDHQEQERPLTWIGQTPCSVETVEQLQREMGVRLRPEVEAALREERALHLSGGLDEPLHEVERRWHLLRANGLRQYLGSLQVVLGM